jgi:hypothetical protein
MEKRPEVSKYMGLVVTLMLALAFAFSSINTVMYSPEMGADIDSGKVQGAFSFFGIFVALGAVSLLVAFAFIFYFLMRENGWA